MEQEIKEEVNEKIDEGESSKHLAKSKSKKKSKSKSKSIDKNASQNEISYYDQFGSSRPHPESLPVIYSEKYNISFLGLEKLHPFDSCKYRNIVNHLIKEKAIKDRKHLIEPTSKPSEEVLRLVHTEGYLKSLKSSSTVASITEIFIVAAMPNFLVQSAVLNPMLLATSGSILAGKIAMERGWAINLSGGYHHCCGYAGGGFCPFADITLSHVILRKNYPNVKNIMIIDLDAHQGNGHERDKLEREDNNVWILDVYNKQIYPGDHAAKPAINCPVELKSFVEDEEYLKKLQTALDTSFSAFTPDIIYYNAGTDILEGDPLGNLSITPKGVQRRDEMVFKYAIERKVPIIMLLSGGYQRSNAAVIGDSIINLDGQFSILSSSTSSSSDEGK